jgi:hypothetical protein
MRICTAALGGLQQRGSTSAVHDLLEVRKAGLRMQKPAALLAPLVALPQPFFLKVEPVLARPGSSLSIATGAPAASTVH